jgi:hypothetical protein
MPENASGDIEHARYDAVADWYEQRFVRYGDLDDERSSASFLQADGSGVGIPL